METNTLNLAKGIVLTLRQKGYEAYFVGGCVRDLALGREPEEYDIVTSAVPEEVRSIFKRTVPVGESFGVMLVVEEGEVFEVATYRTEEGYLDGRHPSTVRLSDSAEQDVLRRDFTINGLLMDPATGEIIDYVGGRRDIERQLIRTIGNPDERFAEDHLRMLRAVRFSSALGFEIDGSVLEAIQINAALIRRISAERIRDEMTKILARGDSRKGLELLSSTGLLASLLPEVDALRGVTQPEQFHPEGDVWEHTLKMIEIFSLRTDRLRADYRLAWGILLHDVGKPAAQSRNAAGIHFYGHARKGEEIAGEILLRLRFSRSDMETIVSLIQNHMHFMNVMEMRPNRLKRFLRMPEFELHLELHRLDCLASHGSLETYEFCREKLSEISHEELRPPRLITGEDLKALGLPPGPLFSNILDQVEDAQLDGELKTREDAIEFVKKNWRAAN